MKIENVLFIIVLLLVIIGLSGIAWAVIEPIPKFGIYIFIVLLALIILAAYYVASRVFKIEGGVNTGNL